MEGCKLLGAAVLCLLWIVTAASSANAKSCSKYRPQCYNACVGHHLETQCKEILCDKAWRNCMKTGVWRVPGYTHIRGVTKK